MMLDRINEVRAGYGLPGLRQDGRLAEAAVRHSRDMAAHSGLMHVGSDGSTSGERIAQAGYRARRWQEVVGWGFEGNIERMIDWWMNSPNHRPILLDGGLVEAGVGYVYAPGSEWGHYWTVDFAVPVKASYTAYAPVVVSSGDMGGIDLLPYLRGDGRAYMVLHPGGASEKFRTVTLPQSHWKLLKNSAWEEFWFTPDYIWRGVDTSPGGGRYYRQFEDNAEGARWCPRVMRVGQRWASPAAHNVQFYDKGSCAPVDVPWNGRAVNGLKLVARHGSRAWNGVTVEDVVELLTHTGETMFFGRGWGLVAWSAGWGSSAVAHVLPASEADNVPEQGCYG